MVGASTVFQTSRKKFPYGGENVKFLKKQRAKVTFPLFNEAQKWDFTPLKKKKKKKSLVELGLPQFPIGHCVLHLPLLLFFSFFFFFLFSFFLPQLWAIICRCPSITRVHAPPRWFARAVESWRPWPQLETTADAPRMACVSSRTCEFSNVFSPPSFVFSGNQPPWATGLKVSFKTMPILNLNYEMQLFRWSIIMQFVDSWTFLDQMEPNFELMIPNLYSWKKKCFNLIYIYIYI